MKTKSTVLTGEERDILILAALHGQNLCNAEIAQRLSISVSRVKTLMHQAYIKLGAHNRYEAILFALRRGEISFTDLYSLDEIAEILSSLGPDTLKKIAQLLRRDLEHGHLAGEEEQIICMNRKQDGILTGRERDVLILAVRGLTNKEIADRLCVTVGTVGIFLNRACTKLGARKRSDAFVLALKQREISIAETCSPKEILQALASLGADSIEKMAQLLDQKLGQEQIPVRS